MHDEIASVTSSGLNSEVGAANKVIDGALGPLSLHTSVSWVLCFLWV